MIVCVYTINYVYVILQVYVCVRVCICVNIKKLYNTINVNYGDINAL